MDYPTEIITHLTDYGTITLTWRDAAFTAFALLLLFTIISCAIALAIKLLKQK